MKQHFKDVPRGSKISIDVQWKGRDGTFSYSARKLNKESIELLDGTGTRMMIQRDQEVDVTDAPHADGDFSYLCNSEYCRCQQ